MKTKVIIENGGTTIVLSPENDFEIDVIEKIVKDKRKYNINNEIDADYNYSSGNYSNHRIELSIKEIK